MFNTFIYPEGREQVKGITGHLFCMSLFKMCFDFEIFQLVGTLEWHLIVQF